MLSKLLSLFPNAVLFKDKPGQPLSSYYLFFDWSNEEWIGIPQIDLSEKEVNILKTLYELYEPLPPITDSNSVSPQARVWHDFLFLNGQPPKEKAESYFRIIQFHLNELGIEKKEIESALKGLFSDKILIVWEHETSGIVIEKHQHHSSLLSEKELASMVETLESDFFIKISFYYGKQYPFTNQLAELFHVEKEYFTFAQHVLGKGKVFSFERVFPVYIACQLPKPLKAKISNEVFEVFQKDTEMFFTIKTFLENNLNASLTAKKLYVHRNTLQYRIDKFTEKTGIQLKDFYGAFTVFLACLVYESEEVQ